MLSWKSLAISAVAVGAFVIAAPSADSAQVSVGVNIGAAPACPYGYFDYAPYDCAPYGYYGPDWFTGGVFLGAGPWFHGPHGWYGHVDNRFDPHYGYHGPLPGRGEPAYNNFHANEARDGRGNIGPMDHHNFGGEHSPGPAFHGGGGVGGFHGGGGHR